MNTDIATPDTARLAYLVPSDGEDIYVESTGSGEAVVFCHGLGGNHAVWWQQTDDFAERFRVITWDQRGFGNSTARKESVGIETAASDLAAVLAALEVERAHIIGQSMGAFVAMEFALQHPTAVSSLTLSTTLAGADPSHTQSLKGAVPPFSVRDRHPVLSEQFCDRHPSLAILYNQISSFGSKPPTMQMLDAMAASSFSAEQLGQIQVPTFVVAAHGDRLCPPTVMSTTANLIPHAEFQVLQGEHSVYFEDPKTWNTAVINFISSHSDHIVR
ncbi:MULTISPECIES: alpha/beta fold hydrolase [unclassified Nocardioides]|uniref:alpha/beta fold hydrolase n=1 Tax=unclassified Nocardioides TaxID=2615069 RepID=UPI0006FB6C63|nr:MULTISPECIES: alpha/beta hydrolase [unclassified Nocardioides]KRA31098.1 hypothetical protein ASD81_16575 [Nocardioides sp. Root614]KRA87718.1 hypothetical protein ASD84_16845 [Nocardioides sp. Root682]